MNDPRLGRTVTYHLPRIEPGSAYLGYPTSTRTGVFAGTAGDGTTHVEWPDGSADCVPSECVSFTPTVR